MRRVAATNNLRTEDEGYGAILALDPLTGGGGNTR